MSGFGNFIIFVCFSIIPALLLFGSLWVAGLVTTRKADEHLFCRECSIVLIVISALIGLGAGWSVLVPLAQSSLALIIGIALCFALLVGIIIWRLKYGYRVLATMSFVIGTHLAVPVVHLQSIPEDDGQAIFWTMPVLDLWLLFGIPVIAMLLAVSFGGKITGNKTVM